LDPQVIVPSAVAITNPKLAPQPITSDRRDAISRKPRLRIVTIGISIS
jgi:hypothetical protein